MLGLVLVSFLLLVVWRTQKVSQPVPINPVGSSQEGVSRYKLASLTVIADVHGDWQNLKAAAQIINKNKFDLVIFLGDLTSTGILSDLQAGKLVLDQTTKPLLVMPGNHDVWHAREEGREHNFYFNQVFSLPPTCYPQKGYTLAFIDNSDENEPINDSIWQEIRNCLENNGNLFLLMHESLYHPVNDRVMGLYDAPLATQAAKLRDLACDHRAKLVLAAHLHSFAKYFYDCPNGYRLPMVVSGALTGDRNFQPPRFLELSIFENGGFEEKEEILK